MPIPFETLGGTGTKVSRGSPRMALVGNRFKFLTDMEGPQDKDILYDLLSDPGETTNVAAQHAEVATAMKRELADFRVSYRRSLAGLDYATPFTPTAYDIPPTEPGFIREAGRAAEVPRKSPAAPVRQDEDSGLIDLTAGTATLHGQLVYRPALQKIGQWTEERDWLSWEFMVYQPGRFDLELTAGQTEPGSTYQIQVGSQTIAGTVAVSGGLNEKKAVIVGTLDLEKTGLYTLVLKPVAKKGAVVMTFWGLDLVPEKNEHGFGD